VGTVQELKSNVQRALEVEKRAAKYLADYGWEPCDVGIAMMLFEETHGAEAVASMGRFIDWAEKNGQQDLIGPTVGHDLNGCKDPTMSPRTAGY